jgi:SAM-dependent methyltransferase
MDADGHPSDRVPSTEDLIDEYNSYYRESLALWEHPERTESTLHILDMYYRGAGGGSPSSALDIGCGTGEVLEALHRRWPGIRLAGLDLSRIAIEAAQRRLPSAELKQGALGRTDLGSRFDLVLLLGTLEHIPDPVAALKDVSGLVADEGIVYIEIPDNLSRSYSEPVEGFRRLNGHNRQIEWHLHRGSWEERIRDSGLEIVLPIEGPYYGGEFIWIASRRKHQVRRKWVRAIHDYCRSNSYRKWTPSILGRIKMGARWMIGSNAYDRLKAQLKGR